ncbi:MAG: GerW family sporulation protein [Spirochaetota bacterium]
MTDSKELIEALVSQVKALLADRSVIGEPLTIGDTTIVPVASYGFGFGGGAGTGVSGEKPDSGSGGGAGGAGGIKPVALVVIDKNGTRVERLRGLSDSFAESVSNAVGRIVEKQRGGTDSDTPTEGGTE